MATAIIGGGIIGLATAYYLSLEFPPSENSNPAIHIIDSSHSLLLSASGYAGGFLAADWFSAPSAPLGRLSFDLHRELAKKHDGYRRWGYAGTRTYSLSIGEHGVSKHGRKAESRHDWLSSGMSRAGVAPENGVEDGDVAVDGPSESLNPDGSPQCFTNQPSGSLTVMAEPDTTAQIEPRLLCEFLLSECRSRGVEVHLSSTPTSVAVDPDTKQMTGICYTTFESLAVVTLSCSKIVLTAGAWTPSVFKTLFPASKYRIPVEPLAGTSLLARSPRYTVPFPLATSADNTTESSKMCFAVYCSPMSATFPGHRYQYAPEAFARLGKDSRPEIWVGGLNHPQLKLPRRAEDVEAMRTAEDAAELRACLVQLCGKETSPVQEQHATGSPQPRTFNEDDLQILREGLCFRPVSQTGVPIIGRVKDSHLDGIKTPSRGGIFIATGHGPWGISLSLGTGHVVTSLLLNRQPCVDVSSLRVR